MFTQFIGMTTSGTQAQLEELIPVDTNKAKYNFIAHYTVPFITWLQLSLNGFANMSTKITTQWEFRLFVFFAERKQWAISLSES